ncbi:MAG TPA: glycosyltransferase [Solirubrobacteraceae bacterium]|nr:glycosyltransferase [Solirubrobacteraceae bacterium]
MKLLYVAMAHDYGRPEQGPSFEEMNFRSALEGMGHELVAFDPVARMAEVGRDAMNVELIALAAETRPDAAFFVLFEDEITPRTLERVRTEGQTVTLNWYTDDHWRFERFSRRFTPVLDWAITTDPDAPAKYRAAGLDNVILSQWACNRYAYEKRTDVLDHDVTFVGLPHGDRPEVIARLAEGGIEVECFGKGWPRGRLGHDEMVTLFGASRINLNLANSSTVRPTARMRVGAWLRGRRVDTRPRPSQIKGRTFEVPGSGGFLLTERVPHLERYFELDREVAVFGDARDLPERIRWWLDHPDERAAVAEAGLRRTLAEHTYDHRFAEIFARAGLA